MSGVLQGNLVAITLAYMAKHWVQVVMSGISLPCFFSNSADWTSQMLALPAMGSFGVTLAGGSSPRSMKSHASILSTSLLGRAGRPWPSDTSTDALFAAAPSTPPVFALNSLPSDAKSAGAPAPSDPGPASATSSVGISGNDHSSLHSKPMRWPASAACFWHLLHTVLEHCIPYRKALPPARTSISIQH